MKTGRVSNESATIVGPPIECGKREGSSLFVHSNHQSDIVQQADFEPRTHHVLRTPEPAGVRLLRQDDSQRGVLREVRMVRPLGVPHRLVRHEPHEALRLLDNSILEVQGIGDVIQPFVLNQLANSLNEHQWKSRRIVRTEVISLVMEQPERRHEAKGDLPNRSESVPTIRMPFNEPGFFEASALPGHLLDGRRQGLCELA